MSVETVVFYACLVIPGLVLLAGVAALVWILVVVLRSWVRSRRFDPEVSEKP